MNLESMDQKIRGLQEEFKESLEQISASKELEELRVRYLGKKGPIQALMTSLRDCSEEERPLVGKKINELKEYVSQHLEEKNRLLASAEMQRQLSEESVDVTLPGRRTFPAHKHPVIRTLDEIIDILRGMGFSVQYTPEIESEYYNYGGLNYPEDHPARDMQDTFYISNDLLLRSHNTTIQQHMMEKQSPPIRVIAPGKCYRNETITSRSHVFFYQVDAFYLDKNVTFADLLATKEEFFSKFFNRKIEIRVRPSYFPFVEPGMEVDIRCTNCEGKGCFLCKKSGWLEVSGAGMVHPKVIEEGGLDPEVYSGYAWGKGVERLCMLRHGISDIRMFTENDMRFLSQGL